jgi:hypothetical protein
MSRLGQTTHSVMIDGYSRNNNDKHGGDASVTNYENSSRGNFKLDAVNNGGISSSIIGNPANTHQAYNQIYNRSYNEQQFESGRSH